MTVITHTIKNSLTVLVLLQKDLEFLKSAKNYEISEINAFSENENAATLFSTLFYNISGNKSNFYNFAADIKALKHNYSVIGLAETNTDPNHGNLYPLDGYKPFGHVQTWLVVLLHCQNGRFSHFYNNSINNYSMVLKLSDMIIIVITNSLRSSAMNNIVKWPSYIEKCNIWLHFSMAQPIIKF